MVYIPYPLSEEERMTTNREEPMTTEFDDFVREIEEASPASPTSMRRTAPCASTVPPSKRCGQERG